VLPLVLRVVLSARGSVTNTRIGRVLQSVHVTHFSGNANNGSHASTFYWNVNNSSSNANRNIGARLKPLTRCVEAPSAPLGEIVGQKSLVAQAKNLAGGN